MKVDPSIYDAPTFDPVVSNAGPTIPAPTYQAPEPVSQAEVLRNTQGAAIAEGAVEEAQREKASALASLGAVASEWSVRQAYDYFAGPTFEPEADFQAGSVITDLPIQLAETERDFLLKSRSSAEYNYRLESVERQRAAGRAAADNPVISFIGGAIDPGYLAIDVASLGAGRLARAALAVGNGTEKLVAGVSAAAGAYALGSVEQQQRPMSDLEVVAGALLNGAATGVFYSRATRKLEKSDPEFPDEVLSDLANKVTIRNPDSLTFQQPHGFDAPVGSFRTGAELVDHLRGAFRGTEYAELVEQLARNPNIPSIKVSTDTAFGAKSPDSKGFWDEGNNLLYIRPDVGRDTALHELVHATVERQLTRNPTTRKELEAMRNQVQYAMTAQGLTKETAFWNKVFEKPEEFVAYALTSPKFREWAKQQEIGASGRSAKVSDFDLVRPEAPAPFPPKPTVWDQVLDFIAKVLGLQGPSAKALRKLNQAEAYARDPKNARFRSLDERLQELVRTVTDAPNLYTRGTVKNIRPDADEVAVRSKVAKVADKEDIGRRISWSLHKTLSNFGDVAKRIADTLVDNPLNMGGDSVVSQARIVRAGLSDLQFQYEDLFVKELAARGAGIKNRIFKPRQALETQRKLEKELQLEMLHRERNKRLNSVTPSKSSPAVKAMADSLDKVYSAALKEMQAAGVRGAEDVAETSGYFSRKWDISNIDEAKQRLQQSGRTAEEADKVILQIVQQGIRRANGWDAQLSRDVAKAILDRAHRKGYFEDAAFRSHAGNAAAAEVRDILTAAGVRGDRLQRALDVLTGVVDEAGKLSTLKHRIDIDMKSGIALPDGSALTVSDLINSDLTRSTEAYLDQVSGRIAMARKGIPDVSDIDKLRTELLESIPTVADRGEAARLFDDTINSILGRPTGEDLPAAMRNLQAVTRMVGLASSGLWQVTEYATAMARFGALKTLKYALKDPTFKAIRNPDFKTSEQLVDVLTRNSSADIRIRPYINRMEDNFDVPAGAIVQSALLQAQQLVPYLNAQKFVQTHQARVVANLVTDTFRRAGEGDQKAINALGEYGLEPHIMTKIQPELKAAGMDTSKWSDETWAAVRGPLQKMMDDSVLRNRTGEIPAFAQFSAVGKFVFTFRSFVLGAHNKVLAGTISRDGLSGISLLMLYQFPLVVLATQANSTIQGKEIKSTEELISKSFGQMGSLGLFSEVFGVVTGQKQQFGAPGLIAVDRLYKLAGDAASLDAGQTAAGAIQATPILSIIPGMRAIGESLKE